MTLLTRKEFREAVFARDKHCCVICNSPAKDAHHIIERRLWPDGGYYLDNGASLCEKCHIKAETTELTCQEIRDKIGIKKAIVPPHLYKDVCYDKWGNIIGNNGIRFPGELFSDESVQKVLKPVIHQFSTYIKYPRTYHLPNSPGKTKDDRTIDNTDMFLNREVVITEKMDGENTTIYSGDGYCHARSIDSKSHPSRTWVRNLAGKIGYQLPEGWRICGENLWAKHSIHYHNLEDFFLVFSIWNNMNECLSWEETVELCWLLDLQTVPTLYKGIFHKKFDLSKFEPTSDESEGFVIRLACDFHYSQFRNSVAKWVRANHVQSSHHWQRQPLTHNRLKCLT